MHLRPAAALLIVLTAGITIFSHTVLAAPGDILWKYDTGGGFLFGGNPAIDDNGVIYVGSNGDLIHAVNPDGTKKWSRNLGNDIYGSTALTDDGILYIGSDNKTLLALHSNDGSIKWTRKLGNFIQSGAAVGGDGTVYLTCADSLIYAFYPGNTPRAA